jgi:hypothetical protein
MNKYNDYDNLLFKTYIDIDTYATLWSKQKPKPNISFKHLPNEDLTLIPNIHYYDDNVLEKIKSYDKDIYSYKFKTNNREVHIHFITANNKDAEKTQITQYIKHMFIWLHMIEDFTNIKCSQKLNIYIFLTPLLKLIPREFGATISTQHANSAFTFSCASNNNIHIFRKEEWFKVFIHECFHNLGLDFSKIDNGFSDKYISELFPLQIDFRLYESYCESWALLINSVFICYNQNQNQKIDNVLKNVKSILKSEEQFSLFQCSKILHHFGISYSDLYSKNEGALFARLNKYKEETPILSYFFIKTIIVLHYSEFIQWCITNNENPFLFMTNNIDQTYTKIKSFVDFIKNIYQSSIVVNSMKTAATKFNNQLKKDDINDTYKFRNLRMSITDL